MLDRTPPDRRRRTERRVADRRRQNRVASEFQIRFLRAGTSADQALSGRLIELSADGARLLLDEPLALHERLLIEVRTPGAQCFSLSAEVVWTEPDPEGRHVTGCRLRHPLSPRQRSLLRKLAHGAAE